MNSIFMNQQQTKTIKYLNKAHPQNEPSENDTEKLYEEQQRQNHKKKVVQKRANLYNHDSNELSNRVYMMDRIDNHHHHHHDHVVVSNQNNRPKNRHHKGKSMDIQQLKVNNKKQGKNASDNKQKNKKIVVNANYLKDLRQRNSISEINHYNFSKKINSQHHRPQPYPNPIPKQKKSKEISTNTHIKPKKGNQLNKNKSKITKINRTSQDKGSKHSQQYTLSYHKNKPYSKSYEIKTERKPHKSQKQQKVTFLSQLKKSSFTMPIASNNLIQIYSNNSSLYSSHEKLQVLNRDHSYIIPTQLSFELDEIRQYESLSINIRSNKSLRKLKKISIIKDLTQTNNNLQHQIYGFNYSTQQIISNYIHVGKTKKSSPELDHSSKDIEDYSIINQQYLVKDSQMGIFDSKYVHSNGGAGVVSGGKNGEGKQDKSLINSLNSDGSGGGNEVRKEEINLNSIINIIKKSENSTNQNKMMIVSKIKELIIQQNKKDTMHLNEIVYANGKKHEQKGSQKEESPNNHANANVNQIIQTENDVIRNDSGLQNQSDLNANSLKSISSNETLENMNLDILDKTLRQRQIYLIQKKQRELLRLYQSKYQSQQSLQMQIINLNKWMDHQIKQVQHTRRQLWKGFNLAKGLICQDNLLFNGNGKNKEMIKCLSDKYLGKNHMKNKQRKDNNNQLQENGNQNVRKNRRKDNKTKDEKGNNTKLERQKVAKESSKKKVKVQYFEEHEDVKLQTIQNMKKFSNSDIEIDVSNQSEDVSEDQLLDSSGKNKIQQQFNQKYQNRKLSDESHDEQHKYLEQDSSQNSIQNNKMLSQAIQLQAPIPNLYATKPPSLGLNVQKIECQIDQQDSFTEQQLIQMSRQSQDAKNSSMRLPKHLSLQDKEDIYEFIFLDLCIQLTDQYNQDSFIMKKIQAFIRNIKQQSKKQKGFKTNSNVIKDYLYQFMTFLKNKPELLSIVHLNLDKPLGPTAIDILKYMHVYDDQQYEEESNQNVFILDIQLFQKFQEVFLNAVRFQKYYNEEEKEQKRILFLKNAVHIHNKAIFDALNEILDKHRPYGVWGEPFSWKKTAKFYHVKDNTLKNNVILQSVQRIIDNSSYMCGFMLDKQDCNLKNNPSITQAYIDHIREDRLSRMLANELEQFQEKMLFIDDEQTQILVEIGQIIYQNLINECLGEIHRLI